MIDIAYAMGQSGQAADGVGGGLINFLPIILMFVIFYFLLIRPQQKKAKEHQNMVNNLKKGDRVITSGGIYGEIAAIDENTVTVEIADKVRIKVSRPSIAGLRETSSADKSK